MNAPSLPWVIGIAVMVAVGAALVIPAVVRYRRELDPPRHRADRATATEPTDDHDEEILRRATRAWQAFADTHDYGPCRYCGTSGSECVPCVRWCCNRCADDPHAHPIVEKGREQ